jgi:uncharacterized protein YgiM (DUF1202 family)
MPRSASRPVPSPDKYREAVQNPNVCFTEEDLKVGNPVTDNLGIPTVASGGFAVVFRLRFPDGRPDAAIRCFKHPAADLKRRYDRITRALESIDLSALVEFTYIEDGIQVGGEAFPIVRMDWAPGVQLDKHIESHQKNSSHLSSLAIQWRQILADLANHDIAHGDLQEGNILVSTDGQIQLIDYDGMFVPSLSGEPPDEVGKPNYQHPERLDSGHYGPNCDTFAGFVIYLSLKALAVRPGLWDQHHTDESLLFKQKDFEEPGRTAIWDDLQLVADQEVKGLTDTLADWCQQSVTDLPLLPEVFENQQPIPPPSPRPNRPDSQEQDLLERLYGNSSQNADSAYIGDLARGVLKAFGGQTGRVALWGLLVGTLFGMAVYVEWVRSFQKLQGDEDRRGEVVLATTTADLNLRTGPSRSESRTTVMPVGSSVQVLRCQEGWCRIHFQGQSGWAARRYLSFPAEDSPEAMENSAPKATSDQASTLKGEEVSIDIISNDKDEDGDYLKIKRAKVVRYGSTESLGNGKIQYTPPPYFEGVAYIYYIVVDEKGQKDKSIVEISVDIPEGDIVKIWREAGLRKRPSINSDITRWIKYGSKVMLIKEINSFYKVKHKNKLGYIEKKLVFPKDRK